MNTEDISTQEQDYPINPGHYLELMDRLYIIMQNLNDFAIEHPLSNVHEPIKDLLVEALDNIHEAYQLVGSLEPENNQ